MRRAHPDLSGWAVHRLHSGEWLPTAETGAGSIRSPVSPNTHPLRTSSRPASLRGHSFAWSRSIPPNERPRKLLRSHSGLHLRGSEWSCKKLCVFGQRGIMLGRYECSDLSFIRPPRSKDLTCLCSGGVPIVQVAGSFEVVRPDPSAYALTGFDCYVTHPKKKSQKKSVGCQLHVSQFIDN
jgi:hypothetical protein